jgi:hypothetical protein
MDYQTEKDRDKNKTFSVCYLIVNFIRDYYRKKEYFSANRSYSDFSE